MNVLCGRGQEKVLLKDIHVLILDGVKVVLYLLLTKVPWKATSVLNILRTNGLT